MSNEAHLLRSVSARRYLGVLFGNREKLIALLFWLLVLGVYHWYARHHGLSAIDALRQIVDLLGSSAYGPLLFIVIYTLRPLMLFSATVLTLAAGFLFGPVWGLLYALIGSNLSATVAYSVGRFFGHGLLSGDHAEGFARRYVERLRGNSFTAILTMRLIFLPYDLVNYLAGLLHVRYNAFIMATILGSLPGSVSLVLAGASLHGDFSGGMPRLDPRVLASSLALVAINVLISRLLRRRDRRVTDKG